MKETDAHKALKYYSANRLLAIGCHVIMEPVLENNGNIDIGAIKHLIQGQFMRIGVECLTSPNNTMIENKINKYSMFFDLLIFAIPENINVNKFNKYLNKKIILWSFPTNVDINKTENILEVYCKTCNKRFFTTDKFLVCPYCKNTKFKINYAAKRVDVENSKDFEFDYDRVLRHFGLFRKNKESFFFNLSCKIKGNNNKIKEEVKRLNTISKRLKKIKEDTKKITNKIREYENPKFESLYNIVEKIETRFNKIIEIDKEKAEKLRTNFLINNRLIWDLEASLFKNS